MSDELHVIDHHLDPEGGPDGEAIYRMVIGTPVEQQREKFDEEGNPVLVKQPLLGPGGEIMRDYDGKEIYLPGGVELETVIEYTPGPDFIFMADDERFAGKSEEEIAQLQRELVKEQLNQREQRSAEEQAQRAARVQLPGSGEAL